MDQIVDKEYMRSLLAGSNGFQLPVDLQPGKLAQQLRGDPSYRPAGVLFVSPSPLLHQIRINALLDGKKLVMPSPGLKDGFVLYKPFSLSFRDISYAVTLRGQSKYGERLGDDCLSGLGVDLVITDTWAIDPGGNCLGDGHGFFDLSVAILSETRAISEKKTIIAIGASGQLLEDMIASDPWDVSMDALITEQGVVHFDHACQEISILWDKLSKKRIKKISPLWKLYCKRNPEITPLHT